MEDMIDNYRAWLNKTHKSNVSASIIARIRRIQAAYDILSEYADDNCASLLDSLTYKSGEEPATDIIIDGDYRKGLASLKSALKSFVEYLDSIGYKKTASIGSAVFEGNYADFKKYVGPKCRNEVNILCKPARTARHGICEVCGNKDVLESAHIVDRPIIIHNILEKKYKVGPDHYRVNLDSFFLDFRNAHLPIEEHIFFLCRSCHDKLDKAHTLTIDEILDKRKSL